MELKIDKKNALGLVEKGNLRLALEDIKLQLHPFLEEGKYNIIADLNDQVIFCLSKFNFLSKQLNSSLIGHEDFFIEYSKILNLCFEILAELPSQFSFHSNTNVKEIKKEQVQLDRLFTIKKIRSKVEGNENLLIQDSANVSININKIDDRTKQFIEVELEEKEKKQIKKRKNSILFNRTYMVIVSIFLIGYFFFQNSEYKFYLDAVDQGTYQVYSNFLKNHPNGKYANQISNELKVDYNVLITGVWELEEDDDYKMIFEKENKVFKSENIDPSLIKWEFNSKHELKLSRNDGTFELHSIDFLNNDRFALDTINLLKRIK